MKELEKEKNLDKWQKCNPTEHNYEFHRGTFTSLIVCKKCGDRKYV